MIEIAECRRGNPVVVGHLGEREKRREEEKIIVTLLIYCNTGTPLKKREYRTEERRSQWFWRRKRSAVGDDSWLLREVEKRI
jgi:hypothetical protein